MRKDCPAALTCIAAPAAQYAAVVSAPDGAALRTAVAAAASGDEGQLSAAARTAALRHIRARCRAAAEASVPRAATVQPASGTAQQADVRLEQLIAEVRARQQRVLNRAAFLLTQMVRDADSRRVDATILAGFTP